MFIRVFGVWDGINHYREATTHFSLGVYADLGESWLKKIDRNLSSEYNCNRIGKPFKNVQKQLQKVVALVLGAAIPPHLKALDPFEGIKAPPQRLSHSEAVVYDQASCNVGEALLQRRPRGVMKNGYEWLLMSYRLLS